MYFFFLEFCLVYQFDYGIFLTSNFLYFLCPVAERHTKLLCSTSEKARKTSAPSCRTTQAARPMKILYLDWDGRWEDL